MDDAGGVGRGERGGDLDRVVSASLSREPARGMTRRAPPCTRSIAMKSTPSCARFRDRDDAGMIERRGGLASWAKRAGDRGRRPVGPQHLDGDEAIEVLSRAL